MHVQQKDLSRQPTMPDIRHYNISEPYLHTACGLGEAPYWERSRNTLRFVDIVKEKLHTVDLSEGPKSHREWNLKYSIGTTADIQGNNKEFIFGGKTGYGIFDRDVYPQPRPDLRVMLIAYNTLQTGDHRIIQQMWTDEEREDDGGGKPQAGKSKEHRMRSNDGAVDIKGRYFVGAMNDPAVVDNPTDEGILFRLDPDLSLHRVRDGVSIPNGISWTPDNKTMYFTDSPSGKIMAYPYNLDTGEASFDEGGKVFFTCPYEGGVPDGHCQDAEGHLWVACFGTGKVVRVDAAGQVVAEIELPTRCVTCPVIAGTELFITTAAEEDPDTFPWSVRYQGAVFKIDIGIEGYPLNRFKMLKDG